MEGMAEEEEPLEPFFESVTLFKRNPHVYEQEDARRLMRTFKRYHDYYFMGYAVCTSFVPLLLPFSPSLLPASLPACQPSFTLSSPILPPVPSLFFQVGKAAVRPVEGVTARDVTLFARYGAVSSVEHNMAVFEGPYILHYTNMGYKSTRAKYTYNKIAVMKDFSFRKKQDPSKVEVPSPDRHLSSPTSSGLPQRDSCSHRIPLPPDPAGEETAGGGGDGGADGSGKGGAGEGTSLRHVRSLLLARTCSKTSSQGQDLVEKCAL
eukprot:766113-Hanusia_phi.AAC.4